MNWKDVGKVVGEGASVVGGLLGGKVGEQVGGLVAAALGVKNTPDDVYDKLQSDPQAIIDLKKFELTHQETLQSLALQETKIYLDDVSSARNREIEVVKSTGKQNLPTLILGCTIALGFFGIVAILLFLDIPQANKEIMLYLLGALSAAFTQLVSYYFGSSAGSARKSEALDKAMQQNSNNGEQH